MWDIPGQLTEPGDGHPPNGKYIGPLSLRQALANDDLAPLQALLTDWPGGCLAAAGALGLNGLARRAHPSRLLFEGGAVHLLDVAQAYGTIANQGVVLGQRRPPMPAWNR